MHPNLFSLGSFTLHTYTLLIDLGILAALFALYRSAPEGKAARWLDAGLAATVGGLIGARLLYALVNGNYYFSHPGEIFQIWLGGLAWPGAVTGGLLGASLYCSRKREPLAPLLDSAALPVGLMGLLSWGGCLAAGCAYGREVAPGELPAWMALNIPDLYGLTVPRWPTQVAGIAWSLITLGLIWAIGRRNWLTGARFAFALSLVALGTFVLGFTRGDPMPYLGGFRLDVVGSALVLLISASVWASLVSRKSPITNPHAERPISNL